MNENWYAFVNEVTYGPYSFDIMVEMTKTRQLMPDTLVYHASLTQWVYASSVDGLFSTYTKPSKKKTKKKSTPKPKWLRLLTTSLMVLFMVSAIGYSIWKVGDITGFWQKQAIAKAAIAWQKEPDYEDNEKAIFQVLGAFSRHLESGDLLSALEYVNPDERSTVEAMIMENPERLPVFLNMLNTLEITFMNSDNDYFAVEQIAIVMAGIPSDEIPSTGTTTIMMVKIDDRWVVDQIR
ncbi:DUF4339 domain-containing protein [Petrocella sp. FN5]|uniref:DUF4339 domain-containing protein n=1 Tax=Petrocella sp. FN5 TaxID=3032002 RepID=UPI0023DBDE19|nr:DUF4339 domain-containing protein [Petrocella sp. FN5]MDF1615870.1 DUF4339 domain-containing protein [Petrocella sp. FN5]